MRILIGTNVLDNVRGEAYANHCQFWFNLGKQMPDVQFFAMQPTRMAIDNMRNIAAKCAMDLECDYLMFVDDDMILHPNTMKSLLNAKKDIVMAHTYIRGYPFKPMSFRKVENPDSPKDWGLQNFTDEELAENADENGLVEAAAVGFACVLINVKLLLELPPPYFLTMGGSTEDIYFCLRCTRELQDVAVAVDMNVPTGHILAPEIVHAATVAELRKYHQYEEKPLIAQDRGEEYLKQCLETL